MKFVTLAASIALAFSAAATANAHTPARPFAWDSATVYFLLTDRFNNANPANDLAYGRKADAAIMRGYMGGDLAGVTAKIKQGYFTNLGVDAIWITPPVEQIHDSTDEGTGKSYGYHGYWAKDFTSVDANLGTEADMRELVDTAHAHGIRVLLDVVMNHTGPVTARDPAWPAEWVRLDPACTYKDAATTIDCVLVKNLPDIRTDNMKNVKLPPSLVAKWKREGRYEREVKELDAFFKRTGYPRAPRYYLIKWHADWVRKYGFDGFRGDTVKHTEPEVWKDLKKVASEAYEDWKRANPSKKLGDDKFYMTAEVYNYSLNHGRKFDMGGQKFVDFYDNGFDSLINFSMASDAKKSYEQIFSNYSATLAGPLKGYSVINYLSSHDDSNPFDPLRTRAFESATKLMLAPGAVQIYYGDETARLLKVEGAKGDATLRSFMNWQDLADNAQRDGYRIADLHLHWSRLGQFRRAHPAVGAGVHQQMSTSPYTFSRVLERGELRDRVVVALDLPTDKPAPVAVNGVFMDGQTVRDYYSGKTAVVADGKVQFDSGKSMVLIGY
ncbi:alpha-amylase [Massilia sp. PAMC28688]|uniref:alpha-amylase family glycosyl hydrolase n=1 Tax=Massilia sp. PAMC28688 TaxID=2861283 RepID=UPI001C625803|nr:alpha-amylase family glycosyl hydrolase [Massilia sp. PAMC28688]QYF91855.1 alpha-amylase [Massilia sp. PAMC28688]